MSMIIKCKMCGGDIEATSDMTIGKCRYCGSTMTLPRIESDKKARLFNKANDYRLNNEFDKAYDAYKSIVEEDEQEAEAYWGMILSEYGIEYVEDPNTRKRIPTCHRTHVQNIQNTTNYELALKYADAERRFMYQDEAEALDKLQRNILAVSSREDDYDVFICYKESEDDGQRTEDSVLAQEIHDELEKAGIHTFFSRISLEDHLGENYEPYIYAALTSAKVMLLVSTSEEHCEAVWVKNEWKRYLNFISDSPEKTLIPVYKGMSPYEFPAELSKFQAQDMSKVGAKQDLIRGVQKLLGRTPKEATNKVLNELVEDRKKREAQAARQRERKKSFVLIPLFAIVAFFAISGYLWSNGYAKFTFNLLYKRFDGTATAFGVFFAAGILLQIAGFVWGLLKRITDNISRVLITIGGVIVLLGQLFLCSRGFRPDGAMWVLIIADIAAVLYSIIIGAKYHNKSDSIIKSGITVALTLIIMVFSLIPIKQIENDENPIVDQIVIKETYGNLRSEASTSSAKMGEVYNGQYYDILATMVDDGKTWYEIETSTGLRGYVIEDNVTVVESLGNQALKLIEEGKTDEAKELLKQMRALGADDSESINEEINKAVESANQAIENAQNRENYEEANSLFNYIGTGTIEQYRQALALMNDLSEESYGDSTMVLDRMMSSLYSIADKAETDKDYSRSTELFGLLSEYSYSDSADRYETGKSEGDVYSRAIADATNAISHKYKANSTEGTPWAIYLKISSNGTFARATEDKDKDYITTDWYTYEYDVDAGVYHFRFGDMRYDATLSADGKTLKLVFTGDDDDRWMSDAGTYYRID